MCFVTQNSSDVHEMFRTFAVQPQWAGRGGSRRKFDSRWPPLYRPCKWRSLSNDVTTLSFTMRKFFAHLRINAVEVKTNSFNISQICKT